MCYSSVLPLVHCNSDRLFSSFWQYERIHKTQAHRSAVLTVIGRKDSGMTSEMEDTEGGQLKWKIFARAGGQEWMWKAAEFYSSNKMAYIEDLFFHNILIA